MIEVSKEAGERKMDIGFIGLGKMGLNMALNVHEQGWPIIGFDVTKEARATAREQGLSVVDSLSELVAIQIFMIVSRMLNLLRKKEFILLIVVLLVASKERGKERV